MKLIITELKKLFSREIFVLMLAAVFILNAYLLFRTASSGEATLSDYRAVYSAIEGMPDDEKLAWLDARLQEYSGQHRYDFDVLHELREECDGVVNYQDFLESIRAQADSMTAVSIFAKPDTFNYRSILKTPPAYENVQDVVPIFDVSKGLTLAADNSFTDILCGFILLFSVLSIMLYDREQGMSGLLFSMRRGRGCLIMTKLAALAITLFGAVLLIYAENLIIGGILYGLGDLTRPIQSVSGFIGCNLRINVWQYLVLYVLFKFIAFFCIGAVLSLIAVNTKNTVSFYGISAAVIVVEGVLYAVIHPLSIYSIFRYINLIAFTKVNEVFCNYKNINFFEQPVPLVPTAVFALIIITATCGFLSSYLYSKKRNLEFRRLGFKRTLGRGKRVHSQLWYTLYKSLILQKGALVIAVFLVISVFMSQTFYKKYDQADVYYEYYTEAAEGRITADTLDFFESEKSRLDDLQAQLDELQKNEPSNYTKINELSKQLAPTMGFDPAYERLQTIKDIDGAYMFYDTGYKRALGKAGCGDDMKYALAAMFLLMFLVSPLIANDNKYRMSFIISSTTSGKQSYIHRNLLTAALYGLFAVMIWILPYSVTISQYYGHGGLFGSLKSITGFADFPLDMKLWQYLLLVVLLRTFFVIISALVMLWISSRCRNSTSAVLINFAVFVLPIIVYLLGAKVMVNIGFCPLLSVNTMLNDFSIIHFSALSIAVLIIIVRTVSSKIKIGLT